MSKPVLRIDSEFSRLFSELKGWDYQELKKDIRENGIKIPILVADDGTIIDGHQRRNIWIELGRNPFDMPMQIKHYDSREEMLNDAIRLNILRRHLNKAQRAYFATKYILPREKEKASKRVGGRPSSEKPRSNLSAVSGKAYQITAQQVGMTENTLRKAEKIFKNASEKVVKSVLSGKTSLSYAYDQVSRKTRHENPPALPEGQYDVIYADPPWKYFYKARGNPEFHYPLMDDQEIYDMEIPSAKDAILFLWATNPKLAEALKVIESWDFDYKTNISWIKDKYGTGFYVRGQHELLLIAKKGSIPTPSNENRPPSILHSPRREHSRKPDEVYELIETMYPNRKYLELFARPENKRENWTYWGLEA